MMAVAYIKSQVHITSAQILGLLWHDLLNTLILCRIFDAGVKPPPQLPSSRLTFPS